MSRDKNEERKFMFLIIFLCAMAVGLLAHWHVRRRYARHNRVPTLSGYTGAEAGSDNLAQAGIPNVTIVEHDEFLVRAAVWRGSRILPEGEGSCWALRQFAESWAHSVRCAHSLSR